MNRILSLAFTSLLTIGFVTGCNGSGDNGGSGSANPVQQNPAAPDPSPLSDVTSIGNIKFDGGLSRKERGAFAAAMDYLDASNVTNPDPLLLQYMHIRSFDRFSVRQFLEDRVQYIIPENADESKLKQLQTNYTNYENPGELPPAIKNGANAEKGHVVMSNIGALIYLVGKSKNILYGVDADGIGTIQMTSPRSGVIQVGEGLFILPAQYPNVVKMFHLTTLIHESHHSDGHGVTTGFLHDKCPSGDYEGMAACDHNLNGPYEIEAMATKELMNNCASCSVKESQIMKILYLDTASRRIDDAQTTAWDDAPEGHR